MPWCIEGGKGGLLGKRVRRCSNGGVGGGGANIYSPSHQPHGGAVSAADAPLHVAVQGHYGHQVPRRKELRGRQPPPHPSPRSQGPPHAASTPAELPASTASSARKSLVWDKGRASGGWEAGRGKPLCLRGRLKLSGENCLLPLAWRDKASLCDRRILSISILHSAL